jgi:hypothetical protein
MQILLDKRSILLEIKNENDVDWVVSYIIFHISHEQILIHFVFFMKEIEIIVWLLQKDLVVVFLNFIQKVRSLYDILLHFLLFDELFSSFVLDFLGLFQYYKVHAFLPPILS